MLRTAISFRSCHAANSPSPPSIPFPLRRRPIDYSHHYIKYGKQFYLWSLLDPVNRRLCVSARYVTSHFSKFDGYQCLDENNYGHKINTMRIGPRMINMDLEIYRFLSCFQFVASHRISFAQAECERCATSCVCVCLVCVRERVPHNALQQSLQFFVISSCE